MTTKAIATRPGQPTEHVDLTPAEEAALAVEVAAAQEASARSHLRKGFIAEGLARIAAQVPAWNSFEVVELLLSIANMLNTANMTPAQSLANDVRLYVRDTALPKVAALAAAELGSVDPTAVDPFGDGTPWPT